MNVSSTKTTASNGLLVFDARVKGFDGVFSVLIDSGATANFVSREALMREHSAYLRCEKSKIRERMQARLADGALIDVANEQVKLPLSFLDFDSQEQMYVIDMNYRYDIILGIPWLQTHEPWVNWKTGEMGASRPAEDVIGSWKDQYLYSLEERQTGVLNISVPDADRGEITHSRSPQTADGRICPSPMQFSVPLGDTAEERDADKLTDVQNADRGGVMDSHSPPAPDGGDCPSPIAADGRDCPSPKQLSVPLGDTAVERDDDKLTDVRHSGKVLSPKRSRLLSFADEHKQPLTRISWIPPQGKRRKVLSKGSTIPGTAKVAPCSETNAASEKGVSRRPIARALAMPGAASDIHQQRLVEFDLAPITDLAKDAESLLALECLPYETFLRDLKQGEVQEVAWLCTEHALELSAVAVTDKQTRFNQQSWERIKDNPSYPVLRQYEDVFPNEVPSRLPVDKGIRHEIDLEPGTKYCITRQWPLPKEQVDAIDAHFAKAHAAGRVRESKSPHSAPTFCVKKATGGWRIVHAYNKLNAATIPAQTPIPRRDTVIDSMHGSTRFTSIDLTDGYYQLLMRESDVALTACSTPSGMLWEWLVMPQGLKNAPATFNRLVTHLFRPMRKFAQTYFDDIFVHSRARDGLSDIEAHNEDLAKVLQCMRDNNLYANLKKCVFNATEIPVLGCFVGKDGVRADPEKVRAVADWPTPRSLKDLRKWLGLANYLHRFSKNYAELARPLTTLLKKDVEFKWTEVHNIAFKAIKGSLLEAPILALPDADTPFWVVCDASDYAIGCALLQHDADGHERVVSYQSRALKPAEKNYPVHDKELLAMKYSLVKFRVYLLGSKPFVIYTDHASLRTATQSPHLSQRMARWLSFFAEYNFTVAYKPGRENILADALSRRPDYDPKEIDQLMGISVVASTLYDEIRHAYESDDQCRPLIEHFSADADAKVELSDSLKASLHRYSYRDRLLFYRVHARDTPRIVVPTDDALRTKLIYEFHDTPISGHVGREKTYAALSERYYWRRMYKHVQRYVRHCEICQTIKSSHCSAAPLQSLPVPHECWTDVSLDYIFGFPTDKHRHNGVLVFVDRLSKMVHLIACSKNIDAKKSAHHFIDHVFKHHGMPERLVSDRDPRFTGNFWTEVFQRLGTKLNMSTAAHPESDGQTERANRVVEDMLRSFCSKYPTEWSSLLPLVEFAINNSVHASTGYTPFFLNHLRNPRVPATLSGETAAHSSVSLDSVNEFLVSRGAVLRLIRDNLAEAQDKQKLSADRSGRSNMLSFAPGQLVLLSTKDLPTAAMHKHMQHTTTKLYPRFIGPFKVLERRGPNAYRLDLPSHFSSVYPVFYVGLLKEFVSEPPLERGMVSGDVTIDPHDALARPSGSDHGPDAPQNVTDIHVSDRPRRTPHRDAVDSASSQQKDAWSLPCDPSRHEAECPVHQDDSLQSLVPPQAPPCAAHSVLGVPQRLSTCVSSTPREPESQFVRTREPRRVDRSAPLRMRDQTHAPKQPQSLPVPHPPSLGALPEPQAAPRPSSVPRERDAVPLPSRQGPLVPQSDLPGMQTDVPGVRAVGSRPRRTLSTPSSTSGWNPELIDENSPSPSSVIPTEFSDESDVRCDSQGLSTRRSTSRRTRRDYVTGSASARAGRTRIASTHGTYTGVPMRSTLSSQSQTGTTSYTVARLVSQRRHRGQVQYLVHWAGYPKSQRTWEPRMNLLQDCPTLVAAFEDQQNVESSRA